MFNWAQKILGGKTQDSSEINITEVQDQCDNTLYRVFFEDKVYKAKSITIVLENECNKDQVSSFTIIGG